MLARPTVTTMLQLAALLATLACFLSGCSDGDGSPPPSGPVDQCVPQVVPTWTPTWHPPREPRPGSCTKAQIDASFTACHSGSGSEGACSVFRANPDNKACNDCWFTNETEAAYGPIIWGANGDWRTNTAGCIAVLDRDKSPQGCGARVQAASACADDACDGCEPFDKFVACREKANSTVCQTAYFDSICLLRPEYAMCTDYANDEQHFRALVDFFCATGPVPTMAGREGGGQ
jgi:hypothetical protein